MKSVAKNFLITAGGTREYIDPVRFITNASSGKMGFALAKAALTAGSKVTLITTTAQLKTENSKLKTIYVQTSAEMFEAVKANFKKCDCLIMAAAVSDYTPARKSKIKIKKSQEDLTIKLKPTTDILKWAGKNKKQNQLVIGFALEDKHLLKNAEKKLSQKNLDMIIANSPQSIGSDKTTVHIKQKNSDWLKLTSTKKFIAQKIIQLL